MRRPPTLASVNQRMTQQRRRNNLGDAEGAKEDLHGFSFRFSEIKLNSKRLMEILFYFLSFYFFFTFHGDFEGFMGSLWRLYGGERAVRYSKPMVSLEYRCCDIIVDITIVIITNSIYIFMGYFSVSLIIISPI